MKFAATLNEENACAAIMRDLHMRSFVIPRYTPHRWWECDVFEITRSGYFREFEVKLTLSDFRNDAKKEQQQWPRPYGAPRVMENKHALLAKGDPRGPAEFSFVAPAGLIPVEQLPAWAGLIELHDRGEGHRPSWRWLPHVVVKAPRLHKQKADDKLRRAALGVCYGRLHARMQELRDRTEEPLLWLDEQPPAVEDVSIEAALVGANECEKR